MYQQCGGKKSMLKFYYKDPTLPLEWGIRPIKEECPDLCCVDLQNCHRGLEVPVNIYVEEDEAEPLVAIDSQGNPIEKEQEEEIRFLLEGIDFEELGGNEIEGDGRKDCEGQGVGGLSLRVIGERTGVELGVDDNLANNEPEYVAENLTENFTEIPVQQDDSNMTDNLTEIPIAKNSENTTENITDSVQNMPDKGKRKLYERFLNESSSEFDDSSDEDYVQSGEGSDSEAPSLVLEDIECESDDDIFLSKDPSKKELMKKLKRVLKAKKNRKIPETRGIGTKFGEHEWASEAENEDDLVSLEGSEGSDTEKHPVYKESASMKNLNLVVGMKFENAAQFRVVLRDWCIRNGIDLEFLRNEAKRVTAKCKVQGCEWRIHASPIQGGPTFQIKTIKGEHTCARTYVNRLANASYIAKRIENAIRDHPTIPVQQLKNRILSKCNVDVSRFKLLVAVGRDGNDNMFPIAMAVVQTENRDTWGWFLGELLDDIGGVGTGKWSFISDRQKGLVEALKDLVPESEHSCGMFQLTGYPCCHTCAAIGCKRAKLEDYVDDYFKKIVYLKVYSDMIHAVPGVKDYIKTSFEPFKPPKIKKKRGRPRSFAERARERNAPESEHQEIPQGSQAPPLSQEQPSGVETAPTGTRRSTLQQHAPTTATQEQVGYFGPRNAALLRNAGSASTQTTSSIPANRRYNKKPTIDQVLKKMKERSKRRQED
ncbi:UNVERIFIED_CONTAM: hypothetical protein Sradi_1822800 [Sesamum radiatum]|uniref:Zinc finger PMZ-type domain-containing protein n=1 Tax=Sesamum radiatum TaxID=300843 RepID=A0AAW2TWE7_SESRA